MLRSCVPFHLREFVMNNVTVKFFNDSNGFGFFRQKSGPDIFVHFSVLIQAGFAKSDMVPDKPAVVEFKQTTRGLVASAIHSIGQKRALLTHRRTLVDNHDGKFIVKVVNLKTNDMHFEVRLGAVDGDQMGENLFCLVDARTQIGKTISHPQAPHHGLRTNIPRTVAKPSGDKQKEKKAA